MTNRYLLGGVQTPTVSGTQAVVEIGTIALLRALATPTDEIAINVLGYYSAGDGGGGQFYWSAASTATDNDGTIIAPDSAPAAGRWLRLPTGFTTANQYGALGDGTTDDTAAVTAVDALTGAKYVPAGIYDTTLAATALDGPYCGDGQIRDVSNNLRGKWFSAIKAAPSSLGTHDSIETAFNGDISKVQFAVEHRITGAATLGQPTSGYTYTPEAYPHYTYLYNSSGYNHDTASNAGRTASAAFRVKLFNAGQGDAPAFNASAFVTGTRAGSTSFLANPAASLFNGDITTDTAGCYLNPGEFALNDGGVDAAGIGWVVNLSRSVATGAKGVWWAGFRAQSQGSAYADTAFSASGKFRFGLDLSFVTLDSDSAAITLKEGQRIYFNVSATDATSLSRYPASVSDYYQEKSSGGSFVHTVVANASSLQVYSNKIASANGHFQMKDGVTEPATVAGHVSIYVDTADGDLKAKFGDGTVKTIVVDT